MYASHSRVYISFFSNDSICILEHDFSLSYVKCNKPGSNILNKAICLFIWSEDDILFIGGSDFVISVMEVAT